VNTEDKKLFILLHILELSVKTSPTSFTNRPTSLCPWSLSCSWNNKRYLLLFLILVANFLQIGVLLFSMQQLPHFYTFCNW